MTHAPAKPSPESKTMTKDIVERLKDMESIYDGHLYVDSIAGVAHVEIIKLRSMLQWCAEETWDGGDIDWGCFQDEMVKAGFFVEVPASEEFKEEWDADTMFVLAWSPLAEGK